MGNKRVFCMLMILLSVSVISDAYFSQRVPENLNVASGVANYIGIGRDSFVKLTTSTGESIIFTCGLGVQSGAGTCLNRKSSIDLENKIVVIEWYPQSIIPTQRKNRIVTIRVGDDYYISRSMTITRINNDFKMVYGLYGLIGVVFAGLFFHSKLKESREGQSCRKDHQQQKP